MNNRSTGFTLIELLIVVAIIGIIAAIAIPNLVSAINRARQKRTMSDMRAIAIAIEAYAVDYTYYPQATSIVNLKPYLDGPYIKDAPLNDGWGTVLKVTCTSFSYTLISYGRDHIPGTVQHGVQTTDFDCDIAYSNGTFSQWPAGVQVEG